MPLLRFFSLHCIEEDTGKLKTSQVHSNMNMEGVPVVHEPLRISTKKRF